MCLGVGVAAGQDGDSLGRLLEVGFGFRCGGGLISVILLRISRFS